MATPTGTTGARRSELYERVSAAARLPSPRVCRLIRQRAGLSLREVGELCDVHFTSVGCWERGSRRPSGTFLVRYAAVMRDLAELSGGAP